MKNKNSESLYNLFWIFHVSCLLGWIFEGIFTCFTKKMFINHSALVIGPYNVAYGVGACLLTEALYRYKDDSYLKLFLIGFIGGTVAELIMGWGMELVLGFCAWDYSDRFLNIDGKVCLLFSIIWGLFGIMWIKLIYPWLIKLINKVNYNIGKKVAIFLAMFLVFNIALTCSAVYRAKQKDKGIEPRNKYEEILDKTFNRDYLKNMFSNTWSD